MTNVPTITLGPNGLQSPPESAILAGTEADINAAFGGGLNMQQTTPQGQLAVSEAAIIGNVYSQFIALANMFDPAFAQGRFQDALARIYFLQRQPALPTTLTIQCNGLPGVTIPVNAQVQDQAGNTYVNTTTGSISNSGNVVLTFAALVAGPTAVPSTVTIFQAIPGWDSATVLSGILGQNVETRSAFETRRQEAVAANSVGPNAAIRGAVLQLPGVIDCYVTDNSTNGTATIGGVVLPPNSLYVAVAQGTASNSTVAQAIWSRKIPGTSYYPGNVTTTVLDQSSGYSPPFPSYQVTYQIPNPLPIFFNITFVASTLIPSNAQALVAAALINAFAGGDGGPAAKIGSLLLASRYAEPIIALGTWAQIRTLFISSPNTAGATIVGSISGTTLTVTSVSAGTIAVGELVAGSGLGGTGTVLPGTSILSQLSGAAGGTGTYGVSNSQTTLSGTLTTTSTLNSSQVQCNINQIPQLFAANVFVSTS
jgi:hypothetical protein